MRKKKRFKEISARELRWQCSLKKLGIKDAKELEPCKDIVGQERALRALRAGVGMTSPGYNVYVSGLTGTGRSTRPRPYATSARRW